MGCSSSTPKTSTQQVAEEPPQAQCLPTLTVETAEERALTQLKLVFDSIDANDDHTVSKEELEAALARDGTLGALIKEAGLNVRYNSLSDLGTAQAGCLSWEDFLAHLRETAVKELAATGELAAAELPATDKALKQLRAVFESIDADGDGAVSKDELAAKLKTDTDEHGLMKEGSFGQLVADAGFNPNFHCLEQLDTNKDGRIAWDEFEQNLKLVQVAKKEVKETGDLSAAVAVQQTEDADDGPAPNGGCWHCLA